MIGPIVSTVVILGISGGAIAAMVAGWRARERAQAHLPAPDPLPASLVSPRATFDGIHYVGTSKADNTLERIAVRPLGFRGRADVEVHDEGIAVGITDQAPFFIPLSKLRGVRTASGTIDRAVERGGLVAIEWCMTPDEHVESFFRVVDPAERTTFLKQLRALIDDELPHHEHNLNESTTTEEPA